MTRIIGGSAGGRRLRTPPGEATRPTSDRVREALFSALESMLGTLAGRRVLDLYAGSGAIALEAASRGAGPVTAVERDRRTARLIGANARDLGLEVAVEACAVERFVAAPAPAAYDLVVADPPYPLPEKDLTAMLTLLDDNGWVAEGGIVVIERSARSVEPTWPPGLRPERRRGYGETALWYVRATRGADRHPKR